MIEFLTTRDINFYILDKNIRREITGFSGVSNVQNGIIVYFLDSVLEQDINVSQQIINKIETLTINATKSSIVADGIDETIITCQELPNEFFVTEILDRVVVNEYAVSDGTLELSSIKAGEYIIEISDNASYRTGIIAITVIEE